MSKLFSYLGPYGINTKSGIEHSIATHLTNPSWLLANTLEFKLLVRVAIIILLIVITCNNVIILLYNVNKHITAIMLANDENSLISLMKNKY